MNLIDILILKFPEVDLEIQVQLQDDGDGVYIKKWDNSLGPKPTKKVLSEWAVEVQAEHDLNIVLRARKEEYPKIDELIVALWEKVVEGDSIAADALEAKRQAVKEKHPK